VSPEPDRKTDYDIWTFENPLARFSRGELLFFAPLITGSAIVHTTGMPVAYTFELVST
jgi:hypothetical protein